jgi:hypothetical protein
MNETIQAGTYYLGDPCYALEDKDYTGIWGNIHKYRNGAYKINGYDFIVHSTFYGDGTYLDTKGRSYYVDSGTIALIDMNIIEKKDKLRLGHVFKFNKNVNFIYDAGFFFVKSGKKYIKINTRGIDNESDEDDDEHCLNDEFENVHKTLIHDEDDDFILSENEETSDESLGLEEDLEDEHIKIEKSEKVIPFQFFKKK